MRRIEYKTVKHEPGLGKRIFGGEFGEGFTQLLSEQGQEGWDLKAVIRISGLQSLLIFGREAA